VLEAPVGTTIGELLSATDGPSQHVGAILLGGYHGGWVSWPEARELPLRNDVLRPLGLSVGAGVVVVLPASACGVAETARVLDYLAGESARQCGPCVFGMPRLAETFRELSSGARPRRRTRRLDELGAVLERRGGCAHPDGSLRFLRSAQQVFAAELHHHARGHCTAVSTRPVLPTPAPAR
jgi:NADH:ubiquinone oxidoreductase subunit F (NADH-binding)